jgi:hypothetical protein
MKTLSRNVLLMGCLLFACMVSSLQAQTGGWGCSTLLPDGSSNMGDYHIVYGNATAYISGAGPDTTFVADTTDPISLVGFTRAGIFYKLTPYYLCTPCGGSRDIDSIYCRLVTQRSNDGVNWLTTDSVNVLDTLAHPLDTLLLTKPARYMRIIQRSLRGNWDWTAVGPGPDNSTWTTAVLEYRVYPINFRHQ